MATIASVAAIYGAGTLCAILTGMGNDGVMGARAVHADGQTPTGDSRRILVSMARLMSSLVAN